MRTAILLLILAGLILCCSPSVANNSRTIEIAVRARGFDDTPLSNVPFVIVSDDTRIVSKTDDTGVANMKLEVAATVSKIELIVFPGGGPDAVLAQWTRDEGRSLVLGMIKLTKKYFIDRSHFVHVNGDEQHYSIDIVGQPTITVTGVVI